jgi:hypothetical protein
MGECDKLRQNAECRKENQVRRFASRRFLMCLLLINEQEVATHDTVAA